MKPLTLLIGFVISLASANLITAQKTLTESEFYAIGNAATDAAELKLPRRVTLVKEVLKDGKLSESSKTVTEYDAIGNSRMTVTDSSRTHEGLSIGKYFYCRENGGPWEKSIEDCRRVSFTTMGPYIKSEFSLKLLPHDSSSLTLVSGKFYFPDGRMDDEMWINPDKTARRQVISYFSSKPGEVTSRRTETYEYKVKIAKIIAPIK